MTIVKPTKDPDFYRQRTSALLKSGYPITIADYDFSSSADMTRWHWHDELEIQYIVEGNLYVTCNEDNFIVQKGDIVFINHGINHFNTPADGNDCIFRAVLINPSFMFGFGQMELENKYVRPLLTSSSLKFIHITPRDDIYGEFVTHLSQIFSLNDNKPDCFEILTKVSVLNIWAIIYKHFYSDDSARNDNDSRFPSLDEQRVKQAVLYIKEHFMEPITLDDIAGSILVNRSECCRCFKRIMNVTPFEYLMKYRIIESTKQMLKKPTESISEIASAVGFNNTSYYNKIFKKYMSCTPTQYRRSSDV